MTLIVIIFSVLLLVYCNVLLLATMGSVKKNSEERSVISEQEIKNISILLPYRNENSNLNALFKALIALEYPKDKLEFIFIDDHSSDHSFELVEEFRKDFNSKTSNLKVDGVGKKKALLKGLLASKNDWIITLDTDCIPDKYWLKSMVSASENKLMVIGLLKYQGYPNNFIGSLLLIEDIAQRAIAIISFKLKNPIIAFGANLLCKRTVMIEFYNQNDFYKSVSGDDLQLLQYLKAKNPSGIGINYDPQVLTNTPINNKECIDQRLRWAGKSAIFKDQLSLLVLGFLVSINLAIVMLPFIVVFYYKFVGIAVFLVALKIMAELIFINRFHNVEDKSISDFKIISCSILYPYYLIFLCAKLLTMSEHNWKNRSYKLWR